MTYIYIYKKYFFYFSEKKIQYITKRDELNKIRLSRFKMEK